MRVRLGGKDAIKVQISFLVLLFIFQRQPTGKQTCVSTAYKRQNRGLFCGLVAYEFKLSARRVSLEEIVKKIAIISWSVLFTV